VANGSTLLEGALRRDRLLVAACLLIAIGLSWGWLYGGAGMMEPMGDMVMPMSSGPWTPGHALLVLAMWAVMMAAMMLPSAAPMILLHATLARRRADGGRPEATAGAAAAGYLAVWSGFSVVATALQYGFEQAALLSPMMETTSRALAGALFVAAGVYQWTPLKQRCLRHCRSPLDFLTSHWRPGPRGAFTMGLQHGLVCTGCCWLLMGLLFVGGVMNLAWIAGIAAFVAVEKLGPGGPLLARAAGTAMVGWGAAIWLSLV
jgi:predicted metal-binding membrane protein